MAAGTGLLKEIEIQPVLSTAAYAPGDVLFETTEIANVYDHRPIRGEGQAENVALNSITLLDVDDEPTVDVDFVFMRRSRSIGTVNLPHSISDANSPEIVGIVSFTTAADSFQLGVSDSKFYQREGIAMQLQQYVDGSIQETSLYVAGILRAGTPTFATNQDITLRFGFTRD